MNQTEEQVKAFLSGDIDAFEEIYKENYKTVYFTCLSFLKNEKDAEDITQDVFETAYKSVNTLEDPAKLQAWICRIAVNKCKNYLKKEKPVLVEDDSIKDIAVEDDELFLPEEYVTNQEKRKIITDIMKNFLTDALYQTVVLYYFNELSVPEIAELMGCPTGTVTYRLSVARARIKEGLEAHEKKIGEKLYSVSLVPLLALFFAAEAQAMEVSAQPMTFLSKSKAPVGGIKSGNGAAKVVKTGSAVGSFKMIALVAIICVVLVGSGFLAITVIVIKNVAENKTLQETNTLTEEMQEEQKTESSDVTQAESEAESNDSQQANPQESESEEVISEEGSSEEITPELATKIEEAITAADSYFVALQTGDIEYLKAHTVEGTDAAEFFDTISQYDWASTLVATYFADFKWSYDADCVTWLAIDMLDEDAETFSMNVSFAMPYEEWVDEVAYLLTFPEETLVEERKFETNEEAINALESALDVAPLTKVCPMYFYFTNPEVTGDYYFDTTELLMDFGIFSSGMALRSENEYPMELMNEILLTSGDSYIGQTDVCEEKAEEMLKFHAYMQNRDFHGFIEWYGNNEGQDYTTILGYTYDDLTDSQKAWVDNYLMNEIRYEYQPMCVGYGKHNFIGDTYVFCYPDLFLDMDNAEWNIENDVMNGGIYSYLRSNGPDEVLNQAVNAYQYAIFYAAENID